MSTEDELKWLTKRGTWRYIPDRYQAMVATIVSALLYFNAFGIIFSDRATGDCGSFLRPRLDGDGSPRGWLTNIFSGTDTYCGRGYFNGLRWEFFFTFAGIAICGHLMRNVIRRENPVATVIDNPSNKSPGWKDDPQSNLRERWWNGSTWTNQTRYKSQST